MRPCQGFCVHAYNRSADNAQSQEKVAFYQANLADANTMHSQRHLCQPDCMIAGPAMDT